MGKENTSRGSASEARTDFQGRTAGATGEPRRISALEKQIRSQEAIREYVQQNQPKSRKNLYLFLFVVFLVVFVATLGGNIADLVTGGTGRHSWYGKEGVINRVFTPQKLGGTQRDSEVQNQTLKSGQANGEEDKTELKPHLEQRIVQDLPSGNGKANKVPNEYFNIADFSLENGEIRCQITQQVDCYLYNFKGNLGQKPGNAVKVTMYANGTTKVSDLGALTSSGGSTRLKTGETAASGEYACSSSRGGMDCWNLRSGKGMLVTPFSADTYGN